MAAIAGNQHELLSDTAQAGLVFGTESTSYLTLAHPSVESDDPGVGNDSPRMREDGVRHGEDYTGSKTVSFEIGVLTDQEDNPYEAGGDALDLFESTWTDPKWRERTGNYAVLRSHMIPGRTRRAYGRPRRFAATQDGLAKKGYSTFVCDFTVSDGKWYDDAARLVQTTGTGDLRQANMTVGGTRRTWPVITIGGGSVTNPKVIIGGLVAQVNVALAAGDSLTIDPRPWRRRITRAWAAEGAQPSMSWSATPLRDLYLAPGVASVVSFSGDPGTVSPTAWARVEWRNAWSRW